MSAAKTTTEILFNSPALHSLKRDQLVKLCKIHSIKASGKNLELIEKLKKVAADLPRDAPLSVAARSEVGGPNDEVASTSEHETNQVYPEQAMKTLPRPSELWEVMESIQESDHEGEDSGSTQGTLKSLGSNREFGTAGSKSSNSTVTSSIKALASSLGLKRGTSSKSSYNAPAAEPSNGSKHASSFPSSPPPMPPLPKHRNFPVDELSLTAKPYSQIPLPSPSQLPQTDHFEDYAHFSSQPPPASMLVKFDFNNTEETAPLPGHILRPGQPAPENARLSLGLGPAPNTPARKGPTTTIRLVSSSSIQSTDENNTGFGVATSSYSTFLADEPQTPQLKPFNTTFDLVMGSPTNAAAAGNVRIYPDLPVDDVVVDSQRPSDAKTVPGALPVPSSVLSPSSAALTSPHPSATLSERGTNPDPFVFGSPIHNVSNSQFQSAAASVLEEMNRRLMADGVDAVGSSVITNLKPGSSVELTPGTKRLYVNNAGREIKPLRKSVGGVKREVKAKFEKAHQEQFDGMESIAGYIHRKNTGLQGMGSLGLRKVADEQEKEPVQIGKKRKSSVLGEPAGASGNTKGKEKRPSTRVISASRRNIPGGFGDEDEDEDEDVPAGKKARVEFDPSNEAGSKEDQEKSEKEREAIRRKLEMNRARRRSSAANGRASMGRGRVSGRVSVGRAKPPPAAKSRFGFLSSAAKSIVKGVWGGNKKKTPATSSTVNASSSTATAQAATTSKSPASTQSTSSGIPTVAPAKGAVSRPTAPGVQRKISVTNTNGALPRSSVVASSSGSSGSSLRVPTTSRSHGRTPSISGTVNSLGSVATQSTHSSARSRSPIPSFDIARTNSVRTSTAATSSTRSSLVKGTSSSRVSSVSGSSSRISSLGTRSRLMSTGTGSTTSQSRLLAPTLSSLAKTSGLSRTKSTASFAQNGSRLALEGVTNIDAGSSTKPSTAVPAAGKIFSKPLVVPPGSGLPSPVRNTGIIGSLGSNVSNAQSTGTTGPTRQRSLQGRKPRISRSKVIAKLASKRAASGSGSNQNSASSSSSAAPGVVAAGKRSSLGVGVHKAPRKSLGGARRSHVGVSGGRGSDVDAAVLMSAKRRIRQSEYARRRSSRAIGGKMMAGQSAMEVDS